LSQPITLGLVIETKDLREVVHLCLKDLPVRILLQENLFGDCATLFEKIERVRPDVLLVDLKPLGQQFEDFFSLVKGTNSPPLLIALSDSADPDTILTVMHAGADAYVYPPVCDSLLKALDRIVTSLHKQRQGTARGGGKLCGFLSVKGGCGATTIACHAAVELARLGSQEVLLADLDLDAGMVGFLMKSKSRHSILEAMTNTDRLDQNYWSALISNGTPRLKIIRAPIAATEREPVRREDLGTVLRFVRFQYDCTIIDLGRGMNPLVMSALEELDEVFLVTTLDVPALHQAKQIVLSLRERGFATNKLRLVLNRVPRSPDVLPDELEELLGITVYTMLPDDYASIYEAYSEGQLLPAGSALGKQLGRMAAKMAGVAEQPGKKKFSLFGG
jgi:pilus assembly protein CpaE